MTFRVVIDGGHGLYTAGKRTPDGEREWSFNNKVAVALIDALKAFEGVEVLRVDDATGKTDVSLSERTRKANAFNADIYISIHHNANTGKWSAEWTGTETYTFVGKNAEAERLASIIHAHIVRAYGLKDRGLKKADFQVLRDTKMPAILLEGGYMDSTIDIKKMRNDAVLKNVGIEIANGIAEYGKLKRKASAVVKPVVKPAVMGVSSYTVKKGDTLWGISQATGVSVANIKSYNKLQSDLINVGDVLGLTNSVASVNKPKPVAKPVAKVKYTLPTGVLRKGNKGTKVTQLQKALVAVYFYPDKSAKNNGVDGIFGNDTLDAVKRFQSVHCKSADGIYGAETRAVLDRMLNK